MLAAMALPQVTIPRRARPGTPTSVLGLLADEETWLAELFAFLDYPQVADTRSLCNGLMRE